MWLEGQRFVIESFERKMHDAMNHDEKATGIQLQFRV